MIWLILFFFDKIFTVVNVLCEGENMARNGVEVTKILMKFLDKPNFMFDILTFGELNDGDRLIVFPEPGDNKGHGGFLGTHYILQKK